MRPKLTLVFALLILGPLSAAGWLGLRFIEKDQESVRHRFEALLSSRLADLEQVISRVRESKERQFMELAEGLTTDTDALRELLRGQSGIRQIFVLDKEGDFQHPPPNGPLNRTEEAFLARTKRIFDSKERFFHEGDSETMSTTSRPSSDKTKKNDTPVSRSEHGWYTYYFGSSDHFIFWLHKEGGEVVGFDLDRLAFLAEIVGELPETDPHDDRMQRESIHLVGAGGDPVYIMGLYTPPGGERAVVSRELEAPLGAWRLHYYLAGDTMSADLPKSALVGTLAGLLGLGLAVFGLAVYFLRETGREAREAEQRVTFVNQVSHELKTPLTNIRMYAELLEEEIDEEEEKQRAHLKVIVKESERLSRLIANVLSFARSERKKLTVRPVPARAHEVIGAVIEQFRPGLESAGFEIEARPEEETLANFDPDALGQILANLLGNAEKYAKKGKWVEIVSSRSGDDIIITVTDKGPGVPARAREKIFEPFYRLSQKVAEGVSGTGIGLSISRELARLHGGDLVLIDTTSGSCFRLAVHAPLVKGEAQS